MAQGMVQGVLKQGLKLWIVAGDRVRATVAEARAEYEHRGAGAAHPAAERYAGADLGGAVGAGVIGGAAGAVAGETLSEKDEEGRTSQGSPPPGWSAG